MSASLAAFKDFKRDAQIVFVDSQDESRRDKIPRAVWEIRPEGEAYGIPNAYISSSDGTQGLEFIGKEAMENDLRDAIRDFEKRLEEEPKLLASTSIPSTDIGLADEEEMTPAEEPETQPAGPLAPTQSWSNSDRQKIEAAVEKVEGDTVTFIMSDGTKLPYDINKLSVKSQERIRALVK